MATSVNITYGKLYTIGKSKLCWFQMCANGVGRQSGREDMSKTKMALNPRLRLEVFHIMVKRPSKVGQRKVHSLVRNRNIHHRKARIPLFQMKFLLDFSSHTDKLYINFGKICLYSNISALWSQNTFV